MEFLTEIYNWFAANPDTTAYGLLGLKIIADMTKNGKDDAFVTALQRIFNAFGLEVKKYEVKEKEEDKE